MSYKILQCPQSALGSVRVFYFQFFSIAVRLKYIYFDPGAHSAISTQDLIIFYSKHSQKCHTTLSFAICTDYLGPVDRGTYKKTKQIGLYQPSVCPCSLVLSAHTVLFAYHNEYFTKGSETTRSFSFTLEGVGHAIFKFS